MINTAHTPTLRSTVSAYTPPSPPTLTGSLACSSERQCNFLLDSRFPSPFPPPLLAAPRPTSEGIRLTRQRRTPSRTLRTSARTRRTLSEGRASPRAAPSRALLAFHSFPPFASPFTRSSERKEVLRQRRPSDAIKALRRARPSAEEEEEQRELRKRRSGGGARGGEEEEEEKQAVVEDDDDDDDKDEEEGDS